VPPEVGRDGHDLELKATNFGRVLTAEEKEKIHTLLMSFLGEMGELELFNEEANVNLISGLDGKIEHSSYQAQNAHVELQTRRELIEAALPSRQFMYIPRGKAQHYKNTGVLSKKAQGSFISSHEELIEAGNCYAAGRNDACVFHAMRGLEAPLRALAKLLKIRLSKHPDVATWGDFNRKIAAKIDQLTNTKHTKRRDSEIKFYADVGSLFRYLQFSYRDYVCHKRESYGESEAFEALEHSRKLVERLAKEGLTE
jgi:hypothetical protein